MPIRQDYSSAPTEGLIPALEKTLSAARLQVYLQATGFQQDKALSLYLWNVALGQSFHFPLQIAEVSLRNALQAVLVAEFGENWWTLSDCRVVLGPERTSDIVTAMGRLRKIFEKEPNGDQIISGLMFGFWVAIMDTKYHDRIWKKHIPTTFVGVPSGANISVIYRVADKVATLRNKVFHHEPLLERNISDDYSQIIQLLGHICPVTKNWVKKYCSIPHLIRSRPRITPAARA